MRLGVARLCLDCEEVHDVELCPVCGSETFAFLKRWVTPVARPPATHPRVGKDVPAAERVEQLDTYEQILTPDRPRSRVGRLMARGALGLAALGVARLAWRAGHTIEKHVLPQESRTVEPAPREPDTPPHSRPD
jgi:hypothetical protein